MARGGHTAPTQPSHSSALGTASIDHNNRHKCVDNHLHDYIKCTKRAEQSRGAIDVTYLPDGSDGCGSLVAGSKLSSQT